MLFKDTDDLKRFLAGTQTQMDDGTMMPFVRQAELNYLIPVLGEEFYHELESAYNSEEGPDEEQKAAIERIQYALAYYTLLDAIPFLNVRIGSIGIMEAMGTNNSPVRQWSYNELVSITASNADKMLDSALLFLENNANDYPAWKESDAYTVSKELFINNATELSRYINIQKSRRVYLALRLFIERAEEFYILPALGQTLFDEMKVHVLSPADNAPPYRAVLLSKIRKALAQWSYALALLEINFVATGTGIKMQTESGAATYKSNTDLDQITALRLKAETQAGTYMAELARYLDENAEDIENYVLKTGVRARYQLPDNSFNPSFSV